MKLWEAMKALEEGKKVRRIDWAPNEYIYIDSYNEVINNDEFNKADVTTLVTSLDL